MAEGTIFRHWPTKKALLLGVVRPFLEHVMLPLATGSIQRLLGQAYPSLRALLEALYDDRAAVVQRAPRLLRVLIQELPFHPDVREIVTKAMQEQVLPRFRAALMRLQTEGKMAPIPVDSAIRIIMSTFGGYLVLRGCLLSDRDWDDPTERAVMLDALERGLGPRA